MSVGWHWRPPGREPGADAALMNNPAHAADPDGPAYSVIVYEYPSTSASALICGWNTCSTGCSSSLARRFPPAPGCRHRLVRPARRLRAHRHQGALLQDLERQRLALGALRDHPGVAQDALEGMLREMEKVAQTLSATGKTGQSLRENEWLTSLRGRLSVAGGAIQVDMPSYYSWQHKPQAARCADCRPGPRPSSPVRRPDAGAAPVARVRPQERHRGRAGRLPADAGRQAVPDAARVVDPAHGVFPEISANKYMIWIRFSTQDGISSPSRWRGTCPSR